MTANKMPEMPEAVAWMYEYREDCQDNFDLSTVRFLESWVAKKKATEEPLYTADQMRAMYLAGIAAARACVPEAEFPGNDRGAGWNDCITATLTNLTALEQEAKK